ncbi:GntR family transcriptional regulator [Mitsuaria sp. TWR114]|uniref:GntR family transcriptional regulator n=1 Tax=Mitsuaria sp. TWR114 TaxID=2601731 RepID=UPI002873CADE|nr:GntR family transcriptional regulator [Mitsuaria sp. TWR114]
MHSWNDQAPIYQQLADRLASQLLDGDPPEGEALPSVRALASQYLINPLTVSRALQALVDEGLVESRRGLGMYVRDAPASGCCAASASSSSRRNGPACGRNFAAWASAPRT